MAINAENLRLILGLKLRNLRLEKRLSLKETASRANLSISYLSEIEKGKKYPKPDKLLALATVLGISFDDLVSVNLDERLDPLADTLRSPFFTEFPFDFFGLETQDLVTLFSGDPDRTGALLRTFLEISQMYDVRVEHFLFAALRSYQLMHDNYFADIEDMADAFRAEVGPTDLDANSERTLRRALETLYGYRIDEEELGRNTALKGFRSVYSDSNRPRLYVNPQLLPQQKAFIYAREIGYRVMGLKERARTSSWLKVESFDQVLNNFRASYFAGAVLIERTALVASMDRLFEMPTWDPSALLAIMDEFGATPETFLYRLGQLLPHTYGFQEFFFLRLTQDGETGALGLSKVFNQSGIALPQGFWLDEHYCRRWSGLRLLDRMVGQPGNALLAGSDRLGHAHGQRSRFARENQAFFVFSLARPLAMTKGSATSISLGFRIDETFRKRVRFADDPAVPEEVVGVTCERCPLEPGECDERVASPVFHRHESALLAKEAALEHLLSAGHAR